MKVYLLETDEAEEKVRQLEIDLPDSLMLFTTRELAEKARAKYLMENTDDYCSAVVSEIDVKDGVTA